MKAVRRQGDFLTEDARGDYELEGLQLFQRLMLHITTCLNRLHLRIRQALSPR